MILIWYTIKKCIENAVVSRTCLVCVCVSCVEPEGPLMGGPQEMTMSPVTIFVDFLAI